MVHELSIPNTQCHYLSKENIYYITLHQTYSVTMYNLFLVGRGVVFILSNELYVWTLLLEQVCVKVLGY